MRWLNYTRFGKQINGSSIYLVFDVSLTFYCILLLLGIMIISLSVICIDILNHLSVSAASLSAQLFCSLLYLLTIKRLND